MKETFIYNYLYCLYISIAIFTKFIVSRRYSELVSNPFVLVNKNIQFSSI